ncbi:hypothetical protein DFJ63DRAFT_314232 [Scheffersomyces coipomensis]|uniref:uncharacterized protein n=1 Tax=Scheffersomyces coipomensis TaxID=1788519 RepID=UPI00315D8101
MFRLRRMSSSTILSVVGITGAAWVAAYYYNKPPKGQALPGVMGWVDLKLKESHQISSDVKRYVFQFENEDDVSGLHTASFIVAKLKTPKGEVWRPYTPISTPDQKGTIELMIKSYEDGKFSKHVWDLKPNDTVSFKGPIQAFKWQPNQFKQISLIGGGSGITPLYQLLSTIIKNPEDNTKVDLYYGCKTVDDILLKDELDKIAITHPHQFKVHYFATDAPEDWNQGHKGHINKQYLQDHLPPPSTNDTKIFVCGPPNMFKAICGDKPPPPFIQGRFSGILSELGYKRNQVFKF